MTDLHAYRTSPDLAEALCRRFAAIERWDNTTVKKWNSEHPETPSLWVNDPGRVDPRPIGFGDGTSDQPPPAGLVRTQEPEQLLPDAAESGVPWRAVMERFGQRPKLSQVYARFGLQEFVRGTDNSICRVFAAQVGEDAWILCDATIPLGANTLAALHLTPAPLAEYVAAEDARADRRPNT